MLKLSFMCEVDPWEVSNARRPVRLVLAGMLADISPSLRATIVNGKCKQHANVEVPFRPYKSLNTNMLCENRMEASWNVPRHFGVPPKCPTRSGAGEKRPCGGFS